MCFFVFLCLHLFYENFGRKSILRSDRFPQSESRSRTEGTPRGREERGQRVPGRARTSERTSQRERHSKPQLSPFVCNPFPGFPSPGRLPLACHQRLSVCGWFGARESTSERLRRAFPRVRDTSRSRLPKKPHRTCNVLLINYSQVSANTHTSPIPSALPPSPSRLFQKK